MRFPDLRAAVLGLTLGMALGMALGTAPIVEVLRGLALIDEAQLGLAPMNVKVLVTLEEPETEQAEPPCGAYPGGTRKPDPELGGGPVE